MAGSLKDQLLKAGLVSEKQVKQAAHEQRKGSKAPEAKAKAQEVAKREAAAAAAKAERDRELNLKRQEEAQRKAAFAEIKQIVETHRLADAEGEIPFNFTDGSKVKRIYITAQVKERVVAGTLHIVRQGPRYHLLPPEAAEKVRERNAASVIVISAGSDTPAEDDPYAAFKVPDDLVW